MVCSALIRSASCFLKRAPTEENLYDDTAARPPRAPCADSASKEGLKFILRASQDCSPHLVGLLLRLCGE